MVQTEIRDYEKVRDEEITDRQKELEDELAKLEAEEAKADVKRKAKEAAEREMANIRKSFDDDIARWQRAWDSFRSLKQGGLWGDDTEFRFLVDHFKGNTDPDKTTLDETYFTALMGAEAIEHVLKDLGKNDREKLKAEADVLRDEIKNGKGQRKVRAIKRLRVVNSFLVPAGQDPRDVPLPEAMVLRVIPVIPPDLRPMVQLDGGRFATSDLNDLYRRVINRNNRLKRFDEQMTPQIIKNNEKRMLQEAVDALFDNGRRGRPVTGTGNRALKSLSDMLKGKQGRFRQNLLGKRVDYSGRSVIVVGPQLKLHQCGLPKQMALELFKPYVIKQLQDKGLASSIKSAKRAVERAYPEVWGELEEIIRDRPVLLNRAPTLHRLGIQAFEPQLVEGKAIQLHPLVCAAFNADFDGDQMAVHLPLSVEAQAEARVLMLASNNILKPSDGKPVTVPTQDMIIGLHHLTSERSGVVGEGRAFGSISEGLMAYDLDKLHVNAKIKIRVPGVVFAAGTAPEGFADGKAFETTLGKAIFNSLLPADFPYVTDVADKGVITEIVEVLAEKYPKVVVAATLDALKDAGFHWATRSGVTVALSDVVTPKEKKAIIEKYEKLAAKVDGQFEKGLISQDERHKELIGIWTDANNDVSAALKVEMSKGYNTINRMVTSGARGNWLQVGNIAGMRGLVANPKGQIISTPIKNSYREGLSVAEYFIATHGARKGLADTALKTADSGYLTRRLVDVSQDVIIREADCGTTKGLPFTIATAGVAADNIENLVFARTLAADAVDGKGKVVAKAGSDIGRQTIKDFIAAGVTSLLVRSPLTCESTKGVCGSCYGRSMATGKTVDLGEAVGIIAAQSIGEPGTQLTMRTFHTGGGAGESKIANFEIRATQQAFVIVNPNLNSSKSVDELNPFKLTTYDEYVCYEFDSISNSVLSEALDKPEKAQKIKIKRGDYLGIRKLSGKSFSGFPTLLESNFAQVEIVDLLEKLPSLELGQPLVDGKILNKVKIADPIVAFISDNELTVAFAKKGSIDSDEKPLKIEVKWPQKAAQDWQEGLFEVAPKGWTLHLGNSGTVSFSLKSASVTTGTRVRAGQVLGKREERQNFVVEITQGLPRVAELFEARTPKGASPIADATGRVAIDESGAQRKLILTPDNGDDAYSYTILKNAVLLVEDGSHVEVGTQLFAGTLDPKDVLRVRGLREVQTHLVEGVQGVYLSQGVPIHDKHIEVIVRQMLRMVSIVDQGDTELVPGELVDNIRFRAINRDAVSRGAKPATARAELLGITKASLATESWLSAASFQETTRVLTQAALERKSDPLIGLKENVIIGKLIPAGTGLAKYRGVDITANVDEADRKYPQRHFTAGGFSEDAFTYADIESFNSASYDASGFQTEY
jgi:DNA-directed RNA polymerase beta' subunit